MKQTTKNKIYYREDGKISLKMWYSKKNNGWCVYNGIHYMYWKNEVDAQQMYDFHVECEAY